MKNKKQTQKDHAKRRFAERLGVKYSQYINDLLLHKIHSNQFKLIEKQSKRVGLYEVAFTPRMQDMLTGDPVDMLVHIVYDRVRKTIVTVVSATDSFDNLRSLEDLEEL